MGTRSTLDKIPDTIKAELMEKVLQGESFQAVSEWLNKQHSIKSSKSSIWRYRKAQCDKYGALLKLGMPINKIINHRLTIDALGVEKVRQRLLDKLIEKSGALFDYLDDKEAKQ